MSADKIKESISRGVSKYVVGCCGVFPKRVYKIANWKLRRRGKQAKFNENDKDQAVASARAVPFIANKSIHSFFFWVRFGDSISSLLNIFILIKIIADL